MSIILKLNPFQSEKIWGYEKWVLSTHRNGHSTINDSNITLKDYIELELPILKNYSYKRHSICTSSSR